MKVVLYIRCSTSEQDTENQRLALEHWADGIEARYLEGKGEHMTLTSGGATRLRDGRLLNWPWCLSIWRSLGRPVVPTVTSAGRFTIFNLDIIFYPSKFEPERLQALVDWLEERSGQRMSREEPQS